MYVFVFECVCPPICVGLAGGQSDKGLEKLGVSLYTIVLITEIYSQTGHRGAEPDQTAMNEDRKEAQTCKKNKFKKEKGGEEKENMGRNNVLSGCPQDYG